MGAVTDSITAMEGREGSMGMGARMLLLDGAEFMLAGFEEVGPVLNWKLMDSSSSLEGKAWCIRMGILIPGVYLYRLI